jgi:hypothetical protein
MTTDDQSDKKVFNSAKVNFSPTLTMVCEEHLALKTLKDALRWPMRRQAAPLVAARSSIPVRKSAKALLHRRTT